MESPPFLIMSGKMITNYSVNAANVHSSPYLFTWSVERSIFTSGVDTTMNYSVSIMYSISKKILQDTPFFSYDKLRISTDYRFFPLVTQHSPANRFLDKVFGMNCRSSQPMVLQIGKKARQRLNCS